MKDVSASKSVAVQRVTEASVGLKHVVKLDLEALYKLFGLFKEALGQTGPA